MIKCDTHNLRRILALLDRSFSESKEGFYISDISWRVSLKKEVVREGLLFLHELGFLKKDDTGRNPKFYLRTYMLRLFKDE